MPLHLPTAIAAYFDAANDGNSKSGAQCFSQDAIVRDEGKHMHGRAAIESWMQANHQKYAAVATPLEVTGSEGKLRVIAQVAGTFPGSPVSLRFDFTFEKSGISVLEITL